MAQIYIADNEVVAGKKHVYLVFDPNENNGRTDDQLIIRGGPTGNFN